ncbi:MAG: TonB-dependent receptor [Saprospiraceae bacterium]|nr:TonB-dependent receptor [Saprospiraceae bacterium]
MLLKSIYSQILCPLLFIPVGLLAQEDAIEISGTTKSKNANAPLPFVYVVLKTLPDSAFLTGTVSDENGLFTLTDITPGEYLLDVSYLGYTPHRKALFVGSNSPFLDLGALFLEEDIQELDEVLITGKQDALATTMDKKTYTLEENISQSGGSVLQSLNNLPGITSQDGQVLLRGSNRVLILIDGKQSAITGFGNQKGLENIPASAVQKIEIINNPSARYDANGNAGIINIILKKEQQTGFNGTVGLTVGLGALWVRQENLPGIRPQYHSTPKINPGLSVNYRKDKINLFLQADNLYTQTLNKNEFVTRNYDNGTVIHQQLKRNRNTNFFTSKAGLDWYANDHNRLTIAGLYSQESIMDRGDQPFFGENFQDRLRLWQFLEDEVLTAAVASIAFEHKFDHPGEKLEVGFNYTFDREDEKYFFDNTLPAAMYEESFFLIADQQVADFNLDYTKPLRHGLLETGLKFRRRTIPTDMQFNPSVNSPLDPDADGLATYKETIPAIYGNYTYQVKKLEAEIGLRVEYVDLYYEVDPNHNTYHSDGYDYLQPFPNVRLTYSLSDRHKLSAFFNRRVDRPDEVDIRIFPKYDDAEIIKVGNPGLKPQFTNSYEVGYKNIWNSGSFFGAVFHRMADGTITRIATTVDNSELIYTISQNAGKSHQTGIEMVISEEFSDLLTINVNGSGYQNRFDAFTVVNQYPVPNTFTAEKQEIISGNLKLNATFTLANHTDIQLTGIYLAPDLIPQGKIASRFSLDLGVNREIQQGKGSLFINATDLFNTMVIKKEITGNNFSYVSTDYYETQVIRLGYRFKF